MGSTPIVTHVIDREKLLAALYALFTLKTAAMVSSIGVFLVIVLFVFTLLIDALSELCGHIAQVWNASGSLERLVIFFVAIYLFNRTSPFLARLIRSVKGF